MAWIPKSDHLETRIGITRQRNRWADTDTRTYQRWDQVPRRSKHPPVDRLHPLCAPFQCVQIK
jgi:hypothetical protein